MKVVVTKVFSDGTQVAVELPDGATAADAGRQVSAPGNATYRVNGSAVDASHRLGNGDVVTINTVKYTAG